MKNYELDTTLLPEVWITWEKKDGSSIYMNGKDGKRQTNPEHWMRTGYRDWRAPDDGKVNVGCHWSSQKLSRIWVKSGSNLVYAYAKYHEDIERLEVAAVQYDTTRGEYSHEWKFPGHRFFIGKDKSCLLEDGSTYTAGNQTVFKDHWAWSPKYMIRLLTNQHYNDCFVEEFKKFIGDEYFLIGNGSTVKIEHAWHISKWYESSQKARGKGKQQKLTDELTAIPLGDISGLGAKYPIKIVQGEYRSTYTLSDIVYFEKIDDKWCVLRTLNRRNDDTFIEEGRVYIGSDGTTRIVSKGQNDVWVPARQTRNRWYRRYNYIANKDEAMAQCPRIKYIMSAANTAQEYKEVDFLVSALRFPEIEQMCKMGWHSSATEISRSNTPKAELKELFGGYYNDKEKNLLRKVGMTKPQLDVYRSLCGEEDTQRNYVSHEWKQALAKMRQMFGDDLTHLDVDSFGKYLRACKEYRRFSYYGNRYIMDHIGLNLDNARFFKNLVRLMGKRSDIFTIVYDTLCAYQSLRRPRRFDIDWMFKDVSDAVRAHDAITELKRLQDEEDIAIYNAAEAERRKKEEEKRKKLDKERQTYEYEDDQFIIRLPKDANEIVREGSTQHICIGGYVTRHSIGDTNLFFLRQKSAPETPFYAIEMNNSYSIVQIHGFGNKWLGNNPEAIPTVVRWLRKHGIKCSNEILTCKATGYGMSREFVPMPVIN